MALNYFGGNNVYCFVDNYKFGQTFCDKPVISFDELIMIASNFDIVISISETKTQVISAVSDQLTNEKIAYKLFRECVNIEKLPSNPDIAYFKDLHKGEKCFVVGNGPSLRSEDLDILYKNGIKCFGANLISQMYNKTKWRPDYYVVHDPIMMNHMAATISSTEAHHKFVPNPNDVVYNEADKLRKLLDLGLGKTHYFYGVRMSPEKIEFYSDISRILFLGGTVTGSMLQIAAYMGFKNIYLIGVDGTNTHMNDKDYFKERRHFYKESSENTEYGNTYIHADPVYAKLLEHQVFLKLDEHSRINGYRIFNATRGGVLNIFERVKFDDLF